MWEIIDEQGVIFSGTEEEMTSKFNDIMEGIEELRWYGDLKLIQVHKVTR